MLKTLEKIRDGKIDFTSKEIKLLARNGYAKSFAKKGQTNVLERLMKAKPDGVDDDTLCTAFSDACLKGQADVLDLIFQQASDSAYHKIYDQMEHYPGDHDELFYLALHSGSIDTINFFIDFYISDGGVELLTKVLEEAYLWEVDDQVLDEILYIAHQFGGGELVARILKQSENILEGAIQNSHLGIRSEETARAIIRKNFAYFGEEQVLGLFYNACMMAGAPAEVLEEGHSKVILAALDETRRVCGDKIAAKALLSWDIHLVEMAAIYSADDVLDAMRDIITSANDTKITKQVEDVIDQKYGLASPDYFEKTIGRLIAKIESGEASNQDPQEIVKQACEAWIRAELETRSFPREANTHPEDQPREYFKGILEYDPILMRECVLEDMLETNDWESFNLMAQLMGKALGPSASFEIMEFFENAASTAPDVYRGLAEYALENAGPYFVQRKIQRPQDTRFFALHSVLRGLAEDGKNKSLSITIDIARRAGGEQFLHSLIDEFDFAPIQKAIAGENYEGAKLLLDQLDTEQRATALSHLPDQWSQLYDGTISKSDFWQEYGGGAVRWKEVTGEARPDRSYAELSPFRFRPKLYDEILPLLETDAELTSSCSAKLNAYKLSVLFSNREEVERYLVSFASSHDRGEHKSIIDAACGFELPLNMVWSPQQWKPLLLKYGQNAFEFLPSAPKIERYLEGEPFPKTLKELRTITQEMKYERAYQHPRLARLAAKHQWSEERYDYGLDLLQKEGKIQDQLPDLFIDGNAIGYPDFYMVKLASDDPTGLALGDITKDCQAIFKNGHWCTVHGMTSEYGGFYVWKKKTHGEITDNDSIVAQSWAWVGQDHSIVFDSFERGNSANAKLCQPFIEHFAHEVVGKHEVNGQIKKGVISAIRLGTDGYTPPLFIPKTETPSFPIDYNGKYLQDDDGRNGRDSNVQYEIAPIDHIKRKDLVLSPPADNSKAETEAIRYIHEATRRIENAYGIVIKTGIEIEGYAVDTEGQPTSQILANAQVKSGLDEAGYDVCFEHENPNDYYGQYELSTKATEPLEAIKLAEGARKYLCHNAQKFGLGRFDTSALPFAEKEASSAHISLSLWSETGKPLFADNPSKTIIIGDAAPTTIETPLMRAITRGLLEVQRYTVLLAAQNDAAYKRLGNSEWSPSGVAVGENGYSGTSLRIANANGSLEKVRQAKLEDYRIENRLTASDSNLAIAMAATIAGIEYGLQKYTRVLDNTASIWSESMGDDFNDQLLGLIRESFSGSNMHQLKKVKEYRLSMLQNTPFAVADMEEEMPQFQLPATRYEALQLLKNGLDEGPLSMIDRQLFEAIIEQHDSQKTALELDQEMILDAHVIDIDHSDDSPQPV